MRFISIGIRESSSRGSRTAKVAGAATGLGVEVLTHGQRVKIPSETRLTFALETHGTTVSRS